MSACSYKRGIASWLAFAALVAGIKKASFSQVTNGYFGLSDFPPCSPKLDQSITVSGAIFALVTQKIFKDFFDLDPIPLFFVQFLS